MANERRLFNPAWLVKGGWADVLRTHVLSQRPRHGRGSVQIFDAKPLSREDCFLDGGRPYTEGYAVRLRIRERGQKKQLGEANRDGRGRPAGATRWPKLRAAVSGLGLGVWGKKAPRSVWHRFLRRALLAGAARPKPSLSVAPIACEEGRHPLKCAKLRRP